MGNCITPSKTRNGHLDPDDLEALYARWPTEEKQNIERLAVSFKILDKDGSCRYFNLIIIATCLIGGALRRIDLGELQFMLAALGVPVNPKVVSFSQPLDRGIDRMCLSRADAVEYDGTDRHDASLWELRPRGMGPV